MPFHGSINVMALRKQEALLCPTIGMMMRVSYSWRKSAVLLMVVLQVVGSLDS